MEWTKPYYGVQHLGEYSLKTIWCTVVDYGSFALLHVHFPGCGFSPRKTRYRSVGVARKQGLTTIEK